MKLIANEHGLIDFAKAENGSLLTENSMLSATIISIFSDRRAKPDDILPNEVKGQHPMIVDRRGWCGDALNSHRIGSRLYLLTREKQTEETRLRAIEYCSEALEWMIDDNIITNIDIQAEWQGDGHLNMLVTLTLSSGELLPLKLDNILKVTYDI